MDDSIIRSNLKLKILPNYLKHQNSVAIDEVGILGGSFRIDILVLNSILHGFEIKSDQDTLNRLPDQIFAYSRILDKATLVVGYKHAFEAMRMIPEWWGVKLVHQGDRGAIHFEEARSASRNPDQDTIALAMLLWREEAILLLESLSERKAPKSCTVSEICQSIAELTDLSTIRGFVIQRLYSRLVWRFDRQQMLSGDSLQSESKL